MLKIWLNHAWWFKFLSDDEEAYNYHAKQCSYCIMWLDPVYCYIIDMLKEANLLDGNYKEICCSCVVLRYFGLLDRTDDLKDFEYDKINDSLLIELFTKYRDSNGRITIQIRIHDFSKIELF